VTTRGRRILSIAAAPGWSARYEARTVTLVVWALAAAGDRDPEVVGIVQRSSTPDTPAGWLAFADEVEGFEGYTFTGLTTKLAEFD
jgi:hypothetical protein